MTFHSNRVRHVRLFMALPLGVALLTACSGETPPAAPPPPVDASIAAVPLNDVVFDLFDGSYVPFPDATNTLIEQMRDAIVPIYEPSYGGSDDGDWLPDRELIIGYVGEDASYAYPVRMLNFHELVTDTIDDVPLLVTY